MNRQEFKNGYHIARMFDAIRKVDPAYAKNWLHTALSVMPDDFQRLFLQCLGMARNKNTRDHYPVRTLARLIRYPEQYRVIVRSFIFPSCDRKSKNLRGILDALREGTARAVGIKRYADGSGRLTIRFATAFVTTRFASFEVLQGWIKARRSLRDVPVYHQYGA